MGAKNAGGAGERWGVAPRGEAGDADEQRAREETAMARASGHDGTPMVGGPAARA